jgi:hypothetical protein
MLPPANGSIRASFAPPFTGHRPRLILCGCRPRLFLGRPQSLPVPPHPEKLPDDKKCDDATGPEDQAVQGAVDAFICRMAKGDFSGRQPTRKHDDLADVVDQEDYHRREDEWVGQKIQWAALRLRPIRLRRETSNSELISVDILFPQVISGQQLLLLARGCCRLILADSCVNPEAHMCSVAGVSNP